MSNDKKVNSALIWVIVLVIAVVTAAVVIYIVSTGGTGKSEAATRNYNDQFLSTSFIDLASSNCDIQTGLGNVKLPQTSPGVYASNCSVLSKNVNLSGEPVQSATLTNNTVVGIAGGVLMGANFRVKNASLGLYQPISVGQTINFGQSGNELIWKADLFTSDTSASPLLSQVDINYATSAGGGGAPTELTSANCGQRLSSGKYLVKEDISCSSHIAFILDGNNVQVDLGGHTVKLVEPLPPLAPSNPGVFQINKGAGYVVENGSVQSIGSIPDVVYVPGKALFGVASNAQINNLNFLNGGVSVVGKGDAAIFANNFKGLNGVDVTSQLGGTNSYCSGGADSVDGVGNIFNSAIVDSEAPFGACSDLDGSGRMDGRYSTATPGDEGDYYLDDLARNIGTGWITNLAALSSEFNGSTNDQVTFIQEELQAPVASVGRNCIFTEEVVDGEAAAGCVDTKLDVGFAFGNRTLRSTKLDELASMPGSVGITPMLRASNVVTDIRGKTNFDYLAGTSFNGFYEALSTVSPRAGEGPTMRDDLDSSTFDLHTTADMSVLCDGVNVTAGTTSLAGCNYVEVIDVNGNKLWGIEAYYGSEGTPHLKANNAGFDDTITGCVGPQCGDYAPLGSDTTDFADISREAKYQVETGQGEDIPAYLEGSDDGFGDHCKLTATRLQNGKTSLTCDVSALPTNDVPELGGRPANMGWMLAFELGSSNGDTRPQWSFSGTSAAPLVLNSITGIVDSVADQNDSPVLESAQWSLNNVKMQIAGFTAVNNIRDEIQRINYLHKNHVPGAETYKGVGILTSGGSLAITDVQILDWGNADSTIPSTAIAALAASENFEPNGLTAGVVHFDSNASESGIETGAIGAAGFIANRVTIKEVREVGILARSQTAINDATVDITPTMTDEDQTDINADTYYGDVYSVDNNPGLNEGPDGRRPDKGMIWSDTPTALMMQCGQKTITSGANGQDLPVIVPTADVDPFGVGFDGEDEAGDHNNCDAVVVRNVTINGTQGTGMAVDLESGQDLICSRLHDPSLDAACTANPAMSAYFDNINVQALSGAVAPIDESTEQVAQLPSQADKTVLTQSLDDGLDQCAVFSAPGVEELQDVFTTTTEAVSLGTQGATIPANLPKVVVTNLNCGSTSAGSGGIAAYGSMDFTLANSTIIKAPYAAISVSIDPTNHMSRAIGESADNRGTDYAGIYRIRNNKVEFPGQYVPTLTLDYFGDSKEGAMDGVAKDAAGADLFMSLGDTNSTTDLNLQDAFDITGNSFTNGTIWVYGDAAMPTSSAQDYITKELVLNIDGNTTPTGTPVPVASANAPVGGRIVSTSGPLFAGAVEEAAAGLPGTVKAECKVKGDKEDDANDDPNSPIPTGPCAVDTPVYVFDYACASQFDKHHSDQVIAQCEILSQGKITGLDAKGKKGIGDIPAPFGVDLAVIGELVDPLGNSYFSKFKKIKALSETKPEHKAKLKFDIDKHHGFEVEEHEGSSLFVEEPNEVYWDGATATLAIGFESDSPWTIESCLAVTEGYQISGDACQNIIIDQTETEAIFEIVEVGSEPSTTSVSYTFTDPEGNVTRAESTVGVKMSEALAAKKGIAINERGVPLSLLAEDKTASTDTVSTGEKPNEHGLTAPKTSTVSTVDDEKELTTSQTTIIIVVVAGILIILVLAIGLPYVMRGKKK